MLVERETDVIMWFFCDIYKSLFILFQKSWWLPHCIKPWLSNCMKFVIVHRSLSYRLFLRDNYLYSLYSAFTNHVTITLWEGSKVGLVLPVISFLLCLCAREGLSNFSSLLCDCITTQGGRHCIVGVWVKDHWWLLGTHHVIRSCCQSHDLVSRSNITMNGLMLNSSIIFTFGFRFETLVDLRSLPNDVHKARKCSYETAL